jgi:hypothetical protein
MHDVKSRHGITRSDIDDICRPIRNDASWHVDDDGDWVISFHRMSQLAQSVIHDGLGQFYHVETVGNWTSLTYRILPKAGYYAYLGQEPLGSEPMCPDGRLVLRGVTRAEAIGSAREKFGDDFRIYSFGHVDQTDSYTELRGASR